MTRHDLGEFLVSQHPTGAQQFIIGVFAEWAEREHQRSSRRFNKADAIRSYLRALKDGLDTRLLLQPSEGSARKRRKIADVPPPVREKKKLEIAAAMDGMPPGEAVAFLAEATVNWCLALPTDSIRLLPVAPRDESDKSIADAVYDWFVRYFDLWT
jgi:hypothetical protein